LNSLNALLNSVTENV